MGCEDEVIGQTIRRAWPKADIRGSTRLDLSPIVPATDYWQNSI